MTQLMTAQTNDLVPDGEAIATYLDVVFGYTSGLAPLRLLPEKGTKPGRPHVAFPNVGPNLNSTILQEARRAPALSCGVFVVPGTVNVAGSAKAKDIVEMAVVLVDIDHGDIAHKRDHLVRHLGTPALIVASGGVTEAGDAKLHLYWRLKEAAKGRDLERVCDLRASIARKVGGDPAFASAHQPIRVAGSIHGKHGHLTMVRILAHDVVEVEIDDLAEAVDSMPLLGGTGKDTADVTLDAAPVRATELLTRVVREQGQDGITRYDALSKVIGHWIRQVRSGHATLEQGRRAVGEYNAAMIQPPWPDKRLGRDFDALLSRDIARSGPIPNLANDHGAELDHDDPAQEPPAMPAPPLSEDALAAGFVVSAGQDWRRVAAWGSWTRIPQVT